MRHLCFWRFLFCWSGLPCHSILWLHLLANSSINDTLRSIFRSDGCRPRRRLMSTFRPSIRACADCRIHCRRPRYDARQEIRVAWFNCPTIIARALFDPALTYGSHICVAFVASSSFCLPIFPLRDLTATVRATGRQRRSIAARRPSARRAATRERGN